MIGNYLSLMMMSIWIEQTRALMFARIMHGTDHHQLRTGVRLHVVAAQCHRRQEKGKESGRDVDRLNGTNLEGKGGGAEVALQLRIIDGREVRLQKGKEKKRWVDLDFDWTSRLLRGPLAPVYYAGAILFNVARRRNQMRKTANHIPFARLFKLNKKGSATHLQSIAAS